MYFLLLSNIFFFFSFIEEIFIREDPRGFHSVNLQFFESI